MLFHRLSLLPGLIARQALSLYADPKRDVTYLDKTFVLIRVRTSIVTVLAGTVTLELRIVAVS
jgi:hypothetical protein